MELHGAPHTTRDDKQLRDASDNDTHIDTERYRREREGERERETEGHRERQKEREGEGGRDTENKQRKRAKQRKGGAKVTKRARIHSRMGKGWKDSHTLQMP